jgi:hypothetical protein
MYYAKAKEEGRVLLYTSLATDDNKSFRSAFEKANAGVKLDIYRASGTRFCKRFSPKIAPEQTWLMPS